MNDSRSLATSDALDQALPHGRSGLERGRVVPLLGAGANPCDRRTDGDHGEASAPVEASRPAVGAGRR
jgi:hypothetical protein